MAALPPYRAYAAAGTISNRPGCTLSLITGWSGAAVARWLQLFDVAAPAPGAVPRQSIAVPAGANFSFAPSELGPSFGAACHWAVSSTGPTFTAAADNFWVYAEGQGT